MLTYSGIIQIQDWELIIATPTQSLDVVGNMVLATPAGNVRGFSMTSQGGDYNKFFI